MRTYAESQGYKPLNWPMLIRAAMRNEAESISMINQHYYRPQTGPTASLDFKLEFDESGLPKNEQILDLFEDFMDFVDSQFWIGAYKAVVQMERLADYVVKWEREEREEQEQSIIDTEHIVETEIWIRTHPW